MKKNDEPLIYLVDDDEAVGFSRGLFFASWGLHSDASVAGL